MIPVSSIKPFDQHIYSDSTQKFNTKKQLHNDYTMTGHNYTMTGYTYRMTGLNYTMTGYNYPMTGDTLGLHSVTTMDISKYRIIWARIQFVVERSTSECLF
jgi:hypothetical protein